MDTKIGLQMWSVRNAFDQDYVKTLEKIAEIGYKYLQVNSFELTPQGMMFTKDLNAAGLKKELDRIGLKAVSAHFVPEPKMNIEAIAADLHLLEVDTLAVAIKFWSSRQDVIEWNKALNEYGEAFKKHGIQLYYHNHFHEFQVLGGKSIFESMMEETDKDLVMFEFDTYWSVRGGQDPIYWMKKLGTRCDLIHQKDMPATTNPVNLFEKFGYDSEITIDDMWETQDATHFTEIGEGVLNIPSYIQAMRTYNQAKWLFVEQDMTQMTELESIEVSLANINRLMTEN